MKRTPFILRFYRRLYRLDRWFWHRFTALGRLILGASVLSALFALDMRRSYAYQLFAFMAAALIVAYVASWRTKFSGELTRSLPGFATVGQSFTYSVAASPETLRRMNWVADSLVQPWPDKQALRLDAGFRPSRLPWFTYRRWLRQVRRLRGAEANIAGAAESSRGARLELVLKPLRRGYIYFDGLTVGMSDPLGLARSLCFAPLPASLLVLPQRFVVAPRHIGGEGRQDMGQGSAGVGRGQSEEFANLREYRPGDPLRHVHWKSWARFGEPVVKEYELQTQSHIGIMVDHYGVVSGDPKFEEVISIAASVIESSGAGSALALILDDAVEVGERSASGGHDSMLAALATLEGVDEAALQRSYERIAASCSQFGELWCVFTRWDAPRHLLVEAVIRLGVSLRVVVLDDDPASIPLGPMKGDPTRLIGIHPGCAAQVLG